MTNNWTDFVTYDTTSPTFFRYKIDVSSKSKAGSVAGRSRPGKGVELAISFTGSETASALYRQLKVQRISGARLAWAIHYGNVPSDRWVVCLDGDNQNLSLDNLTLMSQSQRQLYRSLVNGSSGVSQRGNGEWKARIRQKVGPDRHYSSHSTKAEAYQAYRLALLKLLRGTI